MQTDARPAPPQCLKLLLSATGGVKSDADNDEHDGKHSNGSDDFHGYNSLIRSIRRSIRRCRTTMPALNRTSPASAKKNVSEAALSEDEISQPAKLISVTTTIPNQTLR